MTLTSNAAIAVALIACGNSSSSVPPRPNPAPAPADARPSPDAAVDAAAPAAVAGKRVHHLEQHLDVAFDPADYEVDFNDDNIFIHQHIRAMLRERCPNPCEGAFAPVSRADAQAVFDYMATQRLGPKWVLKATRIAPRMWRWEVHAKTMWVGAIDHVLGADNSRHYVECQVESQRDFTPAEFEDGMKACEHLVITDRGEKP